jgi:hypothetical protein
LVFDEQRLFDYGKKIHINKNKKCFFFQISFLSHQKINMRRESSAFFGPDQSGADFARRGSTALFGAEQSSADFSRRDSVASGASGEGKKPRSRKKLTEAERIKEMEKQALSAAILKPFIESLFDESKEGGGHGSSKEEEEANRAGKGYRSVAAELSLQPSFGATVGMSGMPSMRYPEALARETAKPFRLNTIVSIDAAPLPTRTAAPVYVELVQPRTGEPPQHAACLNHDYRQLLRNSFTQVLRAAKGTPTKGLAHQRGEGYTSPLGGKNQDDDDDAFTAELAKKAALNTTGGGGGGIGATAQVRPPEIYGQVKQGEMLEDAHLENLMRTVRQVKEKQMYENMWKESQGRFAW